MARYKHEGVWTDGNGRRVDSATVSVYLAGTTTAADVYEASAGGTAVNSVTTDSTGNYKFWADDSDYTNAQLFKITFTKTGFQSKSIDDIAVIQNPNVVDTLNAQTIAGVKTFSNDFRISHPTIAVMELRESSGAADNQRWQWRVQSEQLLLKLLNDAGTGAANIMVFDRTGNTGDLLNILTTNLQHNSVKVPTISSTDTLSNKTLSSCGGVEFDGTNTLKTKIINIGDWNMDTGASTTVAHGLTLSNIRQISATVRNDASNTFYDLNYDNNTGTGNHGVFADGTNVNLYRTTGGPFDNASFDTTSYNRGWVTIVYTV